MPSFGKKKCTVEETMAGLEAPLRAFHEASGGDIEDVAALFAARKDAYGAYESYLGAEHADPSPRKTAAAKRQANAGGFDQRAVKIYG